MRNPSNALILILLIAASAAAQPPEAKMSWLDNGVVRLGVDLNLGGSITYLSKSGTDQNLVNSWDLGRQIQMSYYSGPVPFRVPGHTLNPNWTGIGWNPIQVGDVYGHSSKLLEYQNDGKKLYVKCVPMHWPLDNVPGECTFESWLELEGAVVHARCRLVNDRPDHTQYAARNQEFPAIYTNGPWHRLLSYTGDKPFSGAALTSVEKPREQVFPWASFTATECWAALVDDHDFGLGIWIPGVSDFKGGFAGKPGEGGPHDSPTGYVAPAPKEIIDWNISHEYHYDLIIGSVTEIRKHVYDHAAKSTLPTFDFEKDRRGWTYVNASDTGWPIKGELNVLLEQEDPQLIGPVGCVNAADAGTIKIQAAAHSAKSDARIYWRRIDQTSFNDARSVGFTLIADGEVHWYSVIVAGQPEWKGAITQLRFDPISSGTKGESIRVRSIALEK